MLEPATASDRPPRYGPISRHLRAVNAAVSYGAAVDCCADTRDGNARITVDAVKMRMKRVYTGCSRVGAWTASNWKLRACPRQGSATQRDADCSMRAANGCGAPADG